MDHDELFKRLRRELVGRKIAFVRMVCSSLILYAGCEPGDSHGLSCWFGNWRLSGPEGIVTGSHEVETDSDGGPTQEQMERVNSPVREAIFGRPITRVEMDPRSRDLSLTLADAYCVRTVTSDSGDDPIWSIRENATGLHLYAKANGWHLYFGRV